MKLFRESSAKEYVPLIVWSIVFVGVVSLGSLTLFAQSEPPGHGTIALEGTMKQFYRGANTIIVTTIDGVEHVYHFTKDLVVHGGKSPGADALEGLREGRTVVVHYRVAGSEQNANEIDVIGEDGLKTAEGTITQVDRRRQRITIRFENGKTENLQLTAHASSEGTADDQITSGKVIVYYSDEGGRKVAHFFKKAS